MPYVPMNFQDKIGPAVPAAWLNQLDLLANSVFAAAPDNPTSRAALCADLPMEIINGGTGARSASAALASLGALPASSFTAGGIGSVLYAPTSAESGVTIVNPQYPPYTVDRYGSNVTPGVTDMWAAITAANTAATAAGACVTFLSGAIYGVNNLAHSSPLVMTASWACPAPKCIIRRLDFGAIGTGWYTLTAMQVANLTLQGIIFDGQVTAASSPTVPNQEIGALGSYSDTFDESLWTKSYGVIFRQTQFCTVKDCVFMNFLRAGLRFDSEAGGGPSGITGPPWTIFPGAGLPKQGTGAVSLSLNPSVINCRVQRTRGCFGDGFYDESTESIQYVNCYAYDYQRAAFIGESRSTAPDYGSNGSLYANCTADFGHDAFIGSPPQGNYGFYVEGGGDDRMFINCESKNTSVGFALGCTYGASQGVFRPWTGNFRLKNCSAIRCRSCGYKTGFGTRDVHVLYDGCFAEVNSTAAPWSYSAGVGANGFQLAFTEGSGGPNPTGSVSGHFLLRDCRVDMVAMSATTTANCVNVWQGAVTNAQQLQVDVLGLSTKWLTSAGANDTAAFAAYASTTAPNYGYFGDIIFSGVNNAGAAFKGRAKIRDCTNLTTGVVMISGESLSVNSLLEITDTRCALRCGSVAGSNNGILKLNGCGLVDYRGNPGFGYILATNCFFADAGGLTPDRNNWGSQALGGSEFYFTACRFQRRMIINLGSGTTTNRSQNLKMSNCEFYLQLPYSGGGESMLTLALGGGAYGVIELIGCAFRNVGGQGSATGTMIVCSTTGTLQINGAGNSYDSSYVTGGGNVVQYNSTPSYNNAPSIVAVPFNSVNGNLQIWNAI